MNANKKTAGIVGALFITATAMGILSVVFSPVVEGPNYLTNISEEGNLAIATLLVLIMAGAGVGIGVMMFPILKKQAEGMALGYVSAKIIEAVFIIVAQLGLLSLLALSEGLMTADALEAPYVPIVGDVLLATHDWAILIGVSFVFPVGALLLNYLLYRSEVIPRWLSAWGLIGATVYLTRALLVVLGLLPQYTAPEFLWAVTIAVQEMALAAWLIVKGFAPAEIRPEFTEANKDELAGAHAT